ncbi:hypothetical protein GCM10017782_01250 [Deinococcus ficus]|nr:hypothetical protein GCM10017782_01250 [Deinococcus ficus]
MMLCAVIFAGLAWATLAARPSRAVRVMTGLDGFMPVTVRAESDQRLKNAHRNINSEGDVKAGRAEWGPGEANLTAA